VDHAVSFEWRVVLQDRGLNATPSYLLLLSVWHSPGCQHHPVNPVHSSGTTEACM